MTAEEPCGALIYSPTPPHHCSPPLVEYTEEQRDWRVLNGYSDSYYYVAEEKGSVWECCCGELWVVGYSRWTGHLTWIPWEPRPRTRKRAIEMSDWEPPKKERETPKESRRWWNRRNR